jgi:hypothetical protein
MKPAVSAGRMPLKVSVAARARETAGLAKDVDEVNQYAAVMYQATAYGVADLCVRWQPQITIIRPKVATNSLKSCAGPPRA